MGLIAQAHTTLVVSEVEQELLAGELPQADVHVVSNIHRIRGSARSFEARRDILFVGGFAHPPNMDAVLFFARTVFPRVLEQIPDIRFLVVGSDPPPEIVELADVSLHILGYVPELDELFNTCRLSVAPLRFGAGVKGKVNQSLAYGLPVVATTIAAEGMFLQDGQSVLIANDCQTFADAVVRLYQDQALWNRLSRGDLSIMEEHFSFRVAREAVTRMLAPPEIEKSTQRESTG